MQEMNLRIQDVVQVTKLSRAEVYRKIAKGEFPKQTRISYRCSVWRSSEVQDWIKKQHDNRSH